MKKLLFYTCLLLLANTALAQKVTFGSDIANIIYNNCTSCHRQGAIAPFTLENYNDVYNNRAAILSAVKTKIMPPWSPNTSYTHFMGEKSLNEDQISKIEQWVNSGAPKGEEGTEPPAPIFNDKSQLVNPDFSKRCAKHVVNQTLDDFEFFTMSSDLQSSAFIKNMELVPGNRKIVHHIFVFIDSTGIFKHLVDVDSVNTHNQKGSYVAGGSMDMIKLIGGWLPGGTYYTSPDNMGFRVPKNSYYIIQIHYAPGNYGASDSTQLNIKYTNENQRPMDMKALLDNTLNMTDGPIVLPPNKVTNFHEKATITQDISVISIMPHMHLIGTRLKVYAYDPFNNDTIRLVDDYWNFHWQGMYNFPKMIHLKPGYIIYAEGTYDNTENNKDNPYFPPQTIIAGNSTLTEMMQVFFCYVPYHNTDIVETHTTAVQPMFADQGSEITMYPNPAGSGSLLTIDMKAEDVNAISLYSADGKMIQRYNIKDNGEKPSLQLPNLPRGMYFVKIAGNNSVFTRKLMVE